MYTPVPKLWNVDCAKRKACIFQYSQLKLSTFWHKLKTYLRCQLHACWRIVHGLCRQWIGTREMAANLTKTKIAATQLRHSTLHMHTHNSLGLVVSLPKTFIVICLCETTRAQCFTRACGLDRLHAYLKHDTLVTNAHTEDEYETSKEQTGSSQPSAGGCLHTRLAVCVFVWMPLS